MDTEPDAFLGGRLRLRQPARGAHRAGTDAVLLARLLTPAPGATLYDLGAATGAVGLAAARLSEEARVVLVERDPGLAALARDNVSANGLDGRVAVIEADLLAPGAQRRAAGLAPESAAIVLTNPPFFEAGPHRASPVPLTAAAHTCAVGGLDVMRSTFSRRPVTASVVFADCVPAYSMSGCLPCASSLIDAETRGEALA